MKKTFTLSCLLASCIVLTGCSFFWKDKKVEEENNVNVEFVDPCAAASWVFTLWELWSICKFDDWSFCSTTSFLEWECKKWDKYEEVKYSENKWLLYCSEDYDPVCWEDGYMYMNGVNRGTCSGKAACHLSQNGWSEDLNLDFRLELQ